MMTTIGTTPLLMISLLLRTQGATWDSMNYGLELMMIGTCMIELEDDYGQRLIDIFMLSNCLTIVWNRQYLLPLMSLQ